MSDRLELAQHFARSHAQMAARVLEGVPPDMAMDFISTIPDQPGAQLLASMLPHSAAKCISQLAGPVAARYLSAMEPRTTTRILRLVPKEKQEQIVSKLPWRVATRVSLILNYSLATVGAWVEPSVLTLPLDCTVDKARGRLKGEGYPDYHRVYVIDNSHQVKGFVSLITLIRAEDGNIPLYDMLEPAQSVLKANATVENAVHDTGWQNNDYLPAVDHQGRFLGVLRHATLLEIISSPRQRSREQAPSETFLDLAETCYLGLANVLSTSLAVKKPLPEERS